MPQKGAILFVPETLIVLTWEHTDHLRIPGGTCNLTARPTYYCQEHRNKQSCHVGAPHPLVGCAERAAAGVLPRVQRSRRGDGRLQHRL